MKQNYKTLKVQEYQIMEEKGMFASQGSNSVKTKNSGSVTGGKKGRKRVPALPQIKEPLNPAKTIYKLDNTLNPVIRASHTTQQTDCRQSKERKESKLEL